MQKMLEVEEEVAMEEKILMMNKGRKNREKGSIRNFRSG